jgi:glycosyltransferase involved in cell wall biosynthesis
LKNITIDIRMIDSSGIGTYIQNLVPKIIEKNADVHFHLLGRRAKVQECIREYPNITIIDFDFPIYSVQEQLKLLKGIPKDTDLLWSPHYNIPVFYRGKQIVTVHDVFHLAMPEYVGGFHKKLYAKFLFGRVGEKCSKIIAVSEFTRKEIVRLVGINEEKINVIHNSVASRWFEITKGKSPHNKPYILFVGNVKPHKNLISLLRTFNQIKNDIFHDIVIVGKKEGFITGDRYVMETAESLGNRVFFTGLVSQDKLEQYFINAEIFVFPSLYEGFGLPPLEAMACGCPVISSNAASLPEVCGDAVLYIDPHSPEDIAEKIRQVLSDDSLRNELKRKGLERAREFSWEKCADEFWEIIKQEIN